MNTKLKRIVPGELGTPAVDDILNELIGIAQRTAHIKVANTTGDTLPKGTLVAFDGYDTTLAAVTVVKADAAPPRLCDAVLSEAIETDHAGIAYTAGVVGGLVADVAVGTKVYLSETAGDFAFAAPSDPGDAAQLVGVVTVRHAAAGSILFFPGAAAPGSLAGAYSLPADGIPSTDMTDEVQTSLGLADSAYQRPEGGIPSSDLDTAVQASLAAGVIAVPQQLSGPTRELQPEGDQELGWDSISFADDGYTVLVGGNPWLGDLRFPMWTDLNPDDNAEMGGHHSAISGDGNYKILAKDGGHVFLSTGGSVVKQTPAGDVHNNWAAVAVDADGSVVLAGHDSQLYRRTAGVWAEDPIIEGGVGVKALAVTRDGTVVLAASVADHKLYKWQDGVWADANAPEPVGGGCTGYSGVAVSDDANTIIACCTTGSVYIYEHGTWKEANPKGVDQSASWSSVSISADGSVMAAGTVLGRAYVRGPAGYWNEIQPAGDIDTAWAQVALSADGKQICLAGARLWHGLLSPTIFKVMGRQGLSTEVTSPTVAEFNALLRRLIACGFMAADPQW